MKPILARAGVTTLAALGLAFAGTTAHAQTVIAGFDFENLPTPATGTSPAAPTTITADLGTDAGTATLVPGGVAFANVSGDGTTPGYAYTTPGDDAPGTSTPSNDTLRLGVGKATSNNGSSLVFSASTAGFNTVSSFTYDTYASSASAFQTQTFGYSTNGGTTFTTLTPTVAVPAQGTAKAPVTGADAAGYSPETFNLSGITGLAENPNAEFEIVFSGAPAYAGTAAPNDRLDNVFINGTADTNPSPAPEPSQMAGLTFFLLGVSALAFRARKRANTAA